MHPGDGHDGEVQGRNNEGDNPAPCQPEKGAQSWEQRFRGIQQELDHIKEAVKGWALVSADIIAVHDWGFALPSPNKVQHHVDYLNTYKNQMELHGYQDPVRCRAFAITLKGSALAWFNRLPPASISFFRELSIAFVSHFIGA